MTAKYTPLDLSFLSNKYSPQQDSIRNTAAMIMANAGWSKPSQATLKDIAKQNAAAKQQYNSSHKQSLLSSIFDMLQTPLYGVANALDQATAAHQSDSNDSVITDVGKTLNGFFTGGAKGIAAGMRGSTGILDALPGIDISDEWQSNPANKTHMSDVAIRTLTGMSTADAMKPENWAKIKPILEKANAKPFWNQSLPEALAPGNLDASNAQQKFVRNEMLGTLPVDMVADPTTYIPGGALLKGATSAKAGLTEGLDAARAAGAAEGINPIIAGLKMKNASKFEPKAGLTEASPVSAIGETPKTLPENLVAGLPQGVIGGGKPLKTLSGLGRRELPKQGLEVSVKDQTKLTKGIATLASQGEKGWFYKAAQLLGQHPNVEWTKTEEFLRNAVNAVDKKGLRHNPAKMAPVLAQKLKQDVQAARTSGSVERRVLNTANLGDIVI